jgi:hypothetical protein
MATKIDEGKTHPGKANRDARDFARERSEGANDFARGVRY